MTTDVQKVEHALAEYSRVEAGIADLRARFDMAVFAVDTPEGLEAAKAARLAIREPRYEVERVRKDAKAPILALGKRLDAEAKRITDALLAIENPIDAQIKAEEGRQEAARQARIRAEAERVQAIQDRITEIRSAPLAAALCRKAAELSERIDDLQKIVVDESFAEFRETAERAMAESLAKLREMIAAAQAREEDARKLAEERAALQRQREEQETREREEAQRREEAESVLRAREAAIAERERSQREAEEAARRAEEERQAAAEKPVEPEPVVELPPAEQIEPGVTHQVEPGVAYHRPADADLCAIVAGCFAVPEYVADEWLRAYGRMAQAA